MESKLWNEHRVMGTLLLLGAVVFWIGAFMPLFDSKGQVVWLLPLAEQLAVIGDNTGMWQWAHALFVAGAVITLLGIAGLGVELEDTGGRLFARLATTIYLLSAVCWLVLVAFRSQVGVWASQEVVRTGVMPAFYEGLSSGLQALFMTYTVLAIVALALVGAALVQARFPAAWIGWFTIAYSLAELAMLVVTRDLAPLFNFVPPFVLGVSLLVKYARVGSKKQTMATGAPAPTAT